MTAKAKELGMDNTNFSNSSGINDPDNYSTVRDILKMSRYLIKEHPEFYKMFAEKEFTWDRTGFKPSIPPMGSGNACTIAKDSSMPSTRVSVSSRRSINAVSRPASWAAERSTAFASSNVFRWLCIVPAMASNAALRTDTGEFATSFEACFADIAKSLTYCSTDNGLTPECEQRSIR